MKDFLEPKLEVLAFSIKGETMLMALSDVVEGEGDGSEGDQTPVIPF